MTEKERDEFLMHYTFFVFKAEDYHYHKRKALKVAEKYNINIDELLSDSTRHDKQYVANNKYEKELLYTLFERLHKENRYFRAAYQGDIFTINMAKHMHCMFGFMIYYAKQRHNEDKFININNLLNFKQPRKATYTLKEFLAL